MNKIINGKKYDTTTAKKIEIIGDENINNFSNYSETLYQKKNGEFLLYKTGGAFSCMRVQLSYNSSTGSSQIKVLSVEEAKNWLSKNADAEKYEEIFGVVDE